MMAIFKPQATGAYHNHVLQETTDMKVQGTSDRNKNTWSVSKPPMKQLSSISSCPGHSWRVFFTNPSDQKMSNRITLPKDRDKTYATCQAPPQCKWILSTEATFPLPRNFRGSISFSPREIFFFPVKGQVEVTSPKKSCEPKSFIFFGGGFKNC